MPTELELETASRIASARLGVAEELRWLLAGFAVFGTYPYTNWLIAIGIGMAVFWLVTHDYDKEYEAAWDTYEKATGKGKYFTPKDTDAPS